VAGVDRAMAAFEFAEVTRLIYDAIWSEYCDWGLEMAKVRLADPSLSEAEREATWWTLVEALDTYLRLLHPVMPFVTEELWAALPHAADDPELLIVARWPAAGERDSALEAEVEAVLQLVRAIRNARAEAKVEPAAWQPVRVFVPTDLRATFETLQPAVARLARARPLEIVADGITSGGAADGLAVVAGDFEAIVAGDADATSAGDRARLERELADAQRLLAAARARLANEEFVSKAPPAVVEGARAREAELAETVERLRSRVSAR
jgi:valyl-tRNA synthetase